MIKFYLKFLLFIQLPKFLSGLTDLWQEQKWEKSLQQIHDETSPDILVKSGDTQLKDYFSKIPRPGQRGKLVLVFGTVQIWCHT